jgi:hypothetical protein
MFEGHGVDIVRHIFWWELRLVGAKGGGLLVSNVHGEVGLTIVQQAQSRCRSW